jgi:hypothetical protein
MAKAETSERSLLDDMFMGLVVGERQWVPRLEEFGRSASVNDRKVGWLEVRNPATAVLRTVKKAGFRKLNPAYWLSPR